MWGASLVQRNAASSRAPLTGDLTRPNALWHALGLTTWPRHVDTALVDWTERTATDRVQLRVPSGTLTDMVHLVAGRTWQFAAITRGQSGIGCAPVPAPAPTETSLPSTYAIGDSVMEDAAPYLARMGITVDAAVGRQFYQGAAILESIAAAGRLPANVVVGLGTNGPMTSTDLDGLLRALHGERRVVLVTVHEPRFWQDTVNAEIHAAAARWPNVRIADWYTASAGHPEWFASDGIHTGPQGGAAYASVVAAALR
jgi:hypothetical protein